MYKDLYVINHSEAHFLPINYPFYIGMYNENSTYGFKFEFWQKVDFAVK